MHKKLAATLTISLFILSTIAIIGPVSAHYTLGNSTSTSPYHVNDFDPHVAGLIGYVWPGGGENTYFGQPNTAAVLPPGYIAPWADSGASPTALNPPGAASYTWYQLAGSAYAPFGAVLVNSTGDLIFAVNATFDFTGTWGTWDILIPPEFGNILPEQVVTSVTNDYAEIGVGTLDQFDRYAPGWTVVQIFPDANGFANKYAGTRQLFQFSGGGIATGVGLDEWYYVRINGVKAPSIAGKYFFKEFFGGNTVSGELPAANGVDGSADYWMPTQNWPVLLVKGEVNPAIAWGTIMYGGYNATLYGKPVEEAGMVWAHMTTRLDPYTGNTLTGAALIDADGYFNATAEGHYEVEGMAPGIYDFYASAAGFPQQLIASGVRVLEGQSLNLNGYVNPGVVIHGNVYTKHGFGEEPWPVGTGTRDYIKIEIYNSPTISPSSSEQLDPKANLVTWSPLPCVADGPGATYMSDATSHDATTCAGLGDYSAFVAFPWHEYGPGTPGYTASAYSQTVTLGDGTTVTDSYSAGHYNANVDPQGVGPAQQWIVMGGTTTPFHFEMGVKGEYGVPSVYDGHVPQMNATWVGGLTAGRYFVRAWITQYVQTELDGVTPHEVFFDVAANEWAGDVAVPIDLRLTDFVNKTVYFHDTPGTIQTSPISTGANLLNGGLFDANGVLWAWNATSIPVKADGTYYDRWNITFYGFNELWNGRDYGIPAGTYTPKVYAKGYRQQTFEQVSLSLSGTVVYISDHLYRGVGFNITIYSTDFEQPRVSRNWVWPRDPIEDPLSAIDIVIYSEPAHTISTTRDDFAYQAAGTDHVNCVAADHGYSGCYKGVFWGSTGTGRAYYEGGSVNLYAVDVFLLAPGSDFHHYSPGSFDTGQYSFRAYTYGYVQKKTFTVYALKGQIADMKINLVIGLNVTVDVLFKKENIITPTNGNYSARIRVFDDSGKLVGEWMSSEGLNVTSTYEATNVINDVVSNGHQFNYVPGNITNLHVRIAGLPTDYGDPIFDSSFTGGDNNWANFGIDASPNYQGGYSVETDFVPWYRNATAGFGVWYPPPLGLLMGESFHTVPGHPQNPFGWTEVGALSSDFLGHSMAPNHLGPYAMRGMWTLPNGHLSGDVSGAWEVDLRGTLGGTIVGFTWSGEFRTISWATVSILGADNYTYNFYSTDGYLDGFAAPGAYKLTVVAPGYTTQVFPVSVSSGQSTSGLNAFLQQSQVPIPEFSGLAVVAFSALAASLYLLRRRRH